jgi:hypothetical protein
MRSLSRPATAAVAVVLAATSASSAAPDPITLDQIMAALRSVHHVEARYIERRYLQALRSPLETRGTLRFDAPDHLEKATDPAVNGSADRLTIKGNQLTIDRGSGAAPMVLALNEHQEIGVLVDSIRATLAGDGSTLQRTFEVTPSGTLEEWQLILQPRDDHQRGLLQWMRIGGHGERITAIDSRDGEGDRSEMSIVELRR